MHLYLVSKSIFCPYNTKGISIWSIVVQETFYGQNCTKYSCPFPVCLMLYDIGKCPDRFCSMGHQEGNQGMHSLCSLKWYQVKWEHRLNFFFLLLFSTRGLAMVRKSSVSDIHFWLLCFSQKRKVNWGTKHQTEIIFDHSHLCWWASHSVCGKARVWKPNASNQLGNKRKYTNYNF